MSSVLGLLCSQQNLKMNENETLTEFYEKLSDIANEYFALGEKLEENVLVLKIVRVLPDRFQTKLTAIEEAKDLDKIKVEELMGSLRTFELNQQIRQKGKTKEIKEKSIALKSSKEKKESSDDEDDEMALLTKNFQKYIKKLGNKKAISKNPKGNFSKPFETNKKGIQCRECEGFGHIQSECANTLKKKKVMTATWSDQDSEQSDEEENSVALTSVHKGIVFNYKDVLCLNNSVQNNENSDNDSDDSDLDEESLKESYKIMYDQWLKVCSENRLMAGNNKNFVEKIEKLEMIIASKNDEIVSLNKEIEFLQKGVKMLNPRSGILDDILSVGKKVGDYSGLESNGSESSRKTVFVKSMNYPSVVSTNRAAGKSHAAEKTELPSVATDLQLKKISPKRNIEHFVPVCHFCGMKGHIRPKCFSLLNLFKKNYVKHFGSMN